MKGAAGFKLEVLKLLVKNPTTPNPKLNECASGSGSTVEGGSRDQLRLAMGSKLQSYKTEVRGLAFGV